MSSHDNTSNKNARMVTGLFRDRGSVERADNCLSARGYSKDDVTLMKSPA